MGLGKAFKKAWKKTVGKAWNEIDDYAIPVLAGGAIGALTGGLGAVAAGSLFGAAGVSVAGAATSGAIAGGVGGFTSGHAAVQSEKAERAQLAAMQDIANKQAAAAAVPVATSVAEQQVVTPDAADMNYATQRRRALSMADTRTSSRLQRWASNGKRRTL